MAKDVHVFVSYTPWNFCPVFNNLKKTISKKQRPSVKHLPFHYTTITRTSVLVVRNKRNLKFSHVSNFGWKQTPIVQQMSLMLPLHCQNLGTRRLFQRNANRRLKKYPWRIGDTANVHVYCVNITRPPFLTTCLHFARCVTTFQCKRQRDTGF